MKTKTAFRLLLLLLSSSFATAQVTESVQVTTADGDGGDVYIKPGQIGNESRLEVKNNATANGPGVTTKSYLKFDLTSLSERIDGLQSATLHLVTNFNHIGGSTGDPDESDVYVFGLTDDTLDDWDESQVVWENAPANDGTSNAFEEGKVISLGSFFVPANADPDPVSFSSTRGQQRPAQPAVQLKRRRRQQGRHEPGTDARTGTPARSGRGIVFPRDVGRVGFTAWLF